MTPNTNSLTTLQSADTKKVLDVIDELRSQGISEYVELPQIIVCGEQSSGKSSVLEAISDMPFPTKDTVCTRFATEVILRHNETSTFKSSIVKSLVSEQIKEQERIQVLDDLQGIEHIARISLSRAIEKAEAQMGIRDGEKTFSSDILRIDLSGPNHPNLTLVDLPGLYQAGSKYQSEADADVVKSLVLSYMKNERSIILAVVSARNDFNNQAVTRLARRIDPSGERTLGLITKPDTLHPGSESEEFYVRLAQNNEVHFKLGWHVLRNRDFPERNITLAARNRKEKQFFQEGVWTAVDPGSLGIDFLKERLSQVLRDHIISQLPNVIQQIDNGIRECEPRLASLGAARSTVSQQRRYLLEVSRLFNERLKDTIDGTYTHPFFEDAMTENGYQKRLRAVIQNTLTTFAEDIRARGHTYDILEANNDDHSSHDDHGHMQRITREAYLVQAINRLRRSRGRELSGLFNPLFVGDLFHEQCRPWEEMVTECIKVIVNATYTVLCTILQDTSDEHTKARLLALWINPRMDVIKCEVDAKMAAILHSHRFGHPITYNNELTNIVQEMQEKRREKELNCALSAFFGDGWLLAGRQTYALNVASFKQTLLSNLQVSMDEYASSCATDFMQAYYRVAREDLIKTVSTAIIEECVVQKLSSLFSAESVLDMDDSHIHSIAAESQRSAVQRQKLTEKMETLEKGLTILRDFQKLDLNPQSCTPIFRSQ
ncbi:hypothetical protein NA57DRAFT_34762 [Rhizodiscina lignyota]|uniref:Dynamin family protein n=1 Tax=Rhizodiscina lignyota TaxID=1504668 RepID=A0A9P4IJS0_9PEZI|nr:hypothetical protein NA57DRAFT_34762 [Rhizodiscina lignyota]